MKRIILIAVIVITASFVFSSCSNSSVHNDTSATPSDSSMIYSCTMHQDVISDHSGKCPKCGMTLVKQKITASQEKMLQDGNYVKTKD
jgi:hypothetical protein